MAISATGRHDKPRRSWEWRARHRSFPGGIRNGFQDLPSWTFMVSHLKVKKVILWTFLQQQGSLHEAVFIVFPSVPTKKTNNHSPKRHDTLIPDLSSWLVLSASPTSSWFCFLLYSCYGFWVCLFVCNVCLFVCLFVSLRHLSKKKQHVDSTRFFQAMIKGKGGGAKNVCPWQISRTRLCPQNVVWKTLKSLQFNHQTFFKVPKNHYGSLLC